jgi:hypothetical protein
MAMRGGDNSGLPRLVFSSPSVPFRAKDWWPF